jgi:hypothetical protein
MDSRRRAKLVLRERLSAALNPEFVSGDAMLQRRVAA